MKKTNDAVTPVISIILALLIVTSAIASILLFGVPYIESLRSDTARENAEMQFNTVIEGLKNLVNSNPGEKKVTPLAINEGSISVDKDESDRIILMYSYNPSYNFTVSGLDDGNNSFWLTMIEGEVTKAEVYWLDDGRTCFLAGTKITMGDGSYKNIENVEVGDFVKSYDEQTEKIVDCKVARVIRHSPEEMTDYYLVINDQLRVTPNHRFYSNGEWVFADNLRVGDSLFCMVEGKKYQIYSIEKVYEREASFDLEVERCHTYFVSMDDNVDVLVHNDFGITDGWLGISSAEYYSHCGDDGSHTVEEALDGTDTWVHNVDHTHELILDLGQTYTIKKVRGRSSTFDDPLNIAIWVSDSLTNWGASVKAGINTWQDTSIWQEVDTTDKNGRYIKIRIYDSEDPNDYINWGQGAFTIPPSWFAIFDAYGCVANDPPNTPDNPTPENNATGVNIDADLSWICSDPDGDPLTYDVRFFEYAGGFMPDPLPTVSYGQEATTYDPGTMNYNTQYYWQIVAYDDHSHPTEGPIWQFTTETENNPPNTPDNPTPTNGATDQDIDVDLSWTGGDPDPGDTVTYDVYFGTSSSPPKVVSNQSATTYDPGTMSHDTQYYWKIIAWDNHGASAEGSIWSFTTAVSGDYITITCPLGGYKWRRGTTQTITWSYTGTGTVNITLYRGDTLDSPIASGISIEGMEYSWEIPLDLVLGNNYRINISHTSGSYYDVSDYFSIVELYEGIRINETCYPDINGEISAKKNFEGTMVIDLYDNNDYHFGTIWLFDSNSMTYKSSSSKGTYNVIMENGEIIYSYPDKRYIKDAAYVYAEGNIFKMHIIQMIASPSSAYGASGSNIRMNTNLYRSHVREKEYVYCFRLQFYGDNADAWLDYYDDTYDFKQKPPDTLFYEPSGAVWFTLTHSIVGFSIL